MFLIVAFLAQVAAPPTLDDVIAAFVKGDAAARAELVKLGIYAIRPLQKSREKAPEKIDALVLELKKTASGSRCDETWKELSSKVTLATTSVEIRVEIGGPLPIDWEAREHLPMQTFVMAMAAADLKKTEATVGVADRPAHEILDQLFVQTGMDYACFHGAIVLGPSERLWPSGPPAKPRVLAEAETVRARAWIEDLDDDSIPVRETATKELRNLGAGVIPILERHFDRKEAEIAQGCKNLAELLAATPRSPFGPSFASRQKPGNEAGAIAAELEKPFKQVRLRGVSLASILEILLGSRDIEYQLRDAAGGDTVIPEVSIKDFPGNDLLSILTQMVGLDYAISGGKVVIDTRERLEKDFGKKP